MTTDQATERLAEIEVLGDEDWNSLTERALQAAVRAGKDWRWDDAERWIARAYRLLGAEPPAGHGGYAWHCGAHPLSLAIGARRREVYGDYD